MPASSKGFTYSIIFKAIQSSGMSKILDLLERIDRKVDALESNVVQLGNKFAETGRKVQTSIGGWSNSLSGFITRLGLAALTLNSINTAAQAEGIQKSIEFATGSVEQGNKAMQFLRDTTEYLGLDFVAATKGYKSLAASLKGTAIENQVDKIFYSLSEGATVMRLSQEEFNGAIVALSQMASKGKVSAEELRGQLGERLPGAFQMAARAMGMTTMELDKAMSEGKIYSDQFLPRFAKEMHRTYGVAVPDAIDSATANFARFGNATRELQVAFGTELLPTVISFLKEYLIPSLSFIKQHIGLFFDLSAAVGSVWLGFKIYNATLPLATLLTGGLTGAMHDLKIAIMANPIGFIIGVIATLATVIIYAWNKFSGFRGVIVGVWEWLKKLGDLIKNYVVKQVMSFGKVLLGVMTLDWNMMKQGFRDGLSSWTDTFSKGGQKLGDAFSDGYLKGVNRLKDVNYKNIVDNFALSSGKTAVDPLASLGLVNRQDAVSKQFSNSLLNKKGGNTDKEDDKLTSGISDITGGGKSVKNITINLGNLVEQFTIQTKNVTEGTDAMTDLVLKKLLQVLNSANQIQ